MFLYLLFTPGKNIENMLQNSKYLQDDILLS
jgi:hypothetical protein